MNFSGKENILIDPMPWGSLTWLANAKISNTDKQTLGICRIKKGCRNALHYHPNCEEILYVLQGHIVHSFDGEEIEMVEGDTITVPANVKHNAVNTGDTEAVMIICYSNAKRETVGV
jgi:quercetin dioxygenase-like cupin family protein